MSPEHSLEGLMLKLKLQYFGHLMWRWLLRKDPNARKDWKQKEKGTIEDEMVGWYQWLNGHEFQQVPGDGEGQGTLMCWCPWGHKESDTTEWLNWLTDSLSLHSLWLWDGRGQGINFERMTWLLKAWHKLVRTNEVKWWTGWLPIDFDPQYTLILIHHQAKWHTHRQHDNSVANYKVQQVNSLAQFLEIPASYPK